MSAEDAERRIRELEEQLQRERTEKQLFKETVYGLLRDSVPSDLPTEDELHKLVSAPEGKPISTVLDELERELS